MIFILLMENVSIKQQDLFNIRGISHHIVMLTIQLRLSYLQIQQVHADIAVEDNTLMKQMQSVNIVTLDTIKIKISIKLLMQSFPLVRNALQEPQLLRSRNMKTSRLFQTFSSVFANKWVLKLQVKVAVIISLDG